MATSARYALLAVALLAIALLATACAAPASSAAGSDEPEVRFLSIEGDVERNIIHNSGTPVANDAAMPGDADFDGVPLTSFIAEAGPSGTPQTLYLFSSGDGFVSSIDYAAAEHAYVYFSAVKGWSIAAPDFPPAASGMDLDRIIVVSEGSQVGLTIVDQQENTTVVPFGQLLLAPQHVVFHLDGTSVNGDRSVSLYTRQYSVALADVAPTYANQPFVVETKNGETYLTDGSGRFILHRQKISYQEITGDIYENIAQIRLR